MTTIAHTPDTLGRPRVGDCSTEGAVTRSLLGYLALAGPFYVEVSMAQALTRPGFSVAHDEWSLLALGHWGWIQTANLVITGVMTIAGAIGVRRAVGRLVPAGLWPPRLLAAYGIALVGAGVFRADPAGGFPPGTPGRVAAQLSGHATLHVLFGSIGFACLIATCFVMARSYTRRGQRRSAVVSWTVGVAFAIAFAGIASGSTSDGMNVAFTVAVVASYAWLSAVAVDLYRRTPSKS